MHGVTRLLTAEGVYLSKREENEGELFSILKGVDLLRERLKNRSCRYRAREKQYSVTTVPTAGAVNLSARGEIYMRDIKFKKYIRGRD